jgi:hypothetical protein
VSVTLWEGWGLRPKVTYEMKDPKTRTREIRSLGECLDETECDNGMIITWGEHQDVVTEEGRVKVVKAVNWLMGRRRAYAGMLHRFSNRGNPVFKERFPTSVYFGTVKKKVVPLPGSLSKGSLTNRS